MNPKALRSRRQKLGWSRAYLARKLRVNPSTVWRWETGRSRVSPFAAAAVMRALGEV